MKKAFEIIGIFVLFGFDFVLKIGIFGIEDKTFTVTDTGRAVGSVE